ncbi:MAG: polyprenyl diphosphate synthase, partial [Candidatus Brocadiia bacterium]|nr:polyprenyl diphosphate synthase [Candidatus Brocadiia bacterium]
REGLPDRVLGELDKTTDMTAGNTGLRLALALNYGSRSEIIDAVRSILADGLAPSDVTEEVFQQHLHTAGLPDPDLIIRTAGEVRLSNFLLWQAAYSEFYATDVRWPDFDEDEVAKALLAYSRRRRRYGRVGPGEPY